VFPAQRRRVQGLLEVGASRRRREADLKVSRLPLLSTVG
jgi:hypothetical protein